MPPEYEKACPPNMLHFDHHKAPLMQSECFIHPNNFDDQDSRFPVFVALYKRVYRGDVADAA